MDDNIEISPRDFIQHQMHSLKFIVVGETAGIWCDTCRENISLESHNLGEECNFTFSHTTLWCGNKRCRPS